MEVQHTSHFIHVRGIVRLGLALCRLLSRWTLSLLTLTILSLNILIFPPPALGILPIFCKGDPLAVNSVEAANLTVSTSAAGVTTI